MLKVETRAGRFYYSVLWHPVARVLKFERFARFFASLPNGGTVLDYGSGDRPYESMMLTKFDAYIAADYPASNAAHSARPDLEILGNRVDLDSASIDCVIVTEVLEHLYEPKAALTEMHRVLKPGGHVIGTVPFAINEHEQPFDFHRYTSFCLVQMFEDTGFDCVEIEYIGDAVGVATSSTCRVMGIVPKLLHKIRLRPLATAAQVVVRIPELIYFGALRCGLNPQRIGYYRCYPLGFAFLIRKPTATSE